VHGVARGGIFYTLYHIRELVWHPNGGPDNKKATIGSSKFAIRNGLNCGPVNKQRRDLPEPPQELSEKQER